MKIHLTKAAVNSLARISRVTGLKKKQAILAAVFQYEASLLEADHK
jgi:hypothetical protein